MLYVTLAYTISPRKVTLVTIPCDCSLIFNQLNIALQKPKTIVTSL